MTTAAERQGGPVSFPIGRTLATPGALRVLVRLNVAPIQLIARHASGDWGDLCEEDRQANARALADRSATTVFLPEEY
jgi:hypothetical protein